MKILASVTRMFLWMTLLTGVIYPLLITAIAQLTMHDKANGSFIESSKGPIGSALIAQKFEEEKYFWSRPSSIDYNPLPSGGSNLGPTSSALKKAVEERKDKILKLHHPDDKNSIPAELLFASGSGLDPDITIATAHFQMARVAKARNIDIAIIKNLIAKLSTKSLLGEEYVNVLLLNKALDDLHSGK